MALIGINHKLFWGILYTLLGILWSHLEPQAVALKLLLICVAQAAWETEQQAFAQR
jgi:hypothetical protein